MTRAYTLKRRAEGQADTRRRIVEAAVDLHSSVGPALTTYSMLAERAGVQRHTLYAHFPEERDLFLACSGLTMERDPPPDAEPWRDVEDRQARLRGILRALYAWYGRNEGLIACVLRDAEHHELTREIAAMRLGPYFAAYRDILGATQDSHEDAMLPLALSFHTWRSLVRDGGLEPDMAAEAMVRALAAQSSK